MLYRRDRARHRRQGGAREGRQGRARPPPRPTPRSSPTITITDRAAAQTDVGTALQGNPDINAVWARTTRARSAPLGAFKAAGKELPCLTETGGNEEVLAAVEDGKIYAVVALQFEADMAQSFDALVTMIDDPEATGVQLTVPQEVVKADS